MNGCLFIRTLFDLGYNYLVWRTSTLRLCAVSFHSDRRWHRAGSSGTFCLTTTARHTDALASDKPKHNDVLAWRHPLMVWFKINRNKSLCLISNQSVGAAGGVCWGESVWIRPRSNRKSVGTPDVISPATSPSTRFWWEELQALKHLSYRSLGTKINFLC